MGQSIFKSLTSYGTVHDQPFYNLISWRTRWIRFRRAYEFNIRFFCISRSIWNV